MTKPVVKISCLRNRGSIDPRTVRRRGEKVLIASGRETAELSILLCDDSFIRELNHKYLNCDSPTDVLSFSMSEGMIPDLNPDLLGDVVISVETAARQAAEIGRKPIDEVTSLLIHGVLHLLGFDHQRPREARQMSKEANRIESVIHGKH
ncbi:MAG: rRNA maturation RNase YbeY [Proteobacteria bacterium]|nr:rRNA maturation RNase YbeY [Pseudomonadota bacterium]